MNPPNPAKVVHQSLRLLLNVVTFLTVVLSTSQMFAAETNNFWSGTNGVSADIYWSDSANWINVQTNGGAAAAGIPGMQGDVTFGNNGGSLEIVPAASG